MSTIYHDRHCRNAIVAALGIVLAAMMGAVDCSAANPTIDERTAGGLKASYHLPVDAEVTLGLYAKTGELLRTLIKSQYRRSGTVVDDWDGLDQWGHPVPAGSYLLKGIYHPHIATSYVMSFGNPGTPPWPTPDGKGDWLSDEAPPQGVATDGRWIYLAAPGNEKGDSIIAVDERGQRQWGAKIGFNPCTVSLAIDGDSLYVLFSGPQLTDSSRRFFQGSNAAGRAVLMRLDKKTGRAAGFSLRDPNLKVASWPYVDNIVNLWDLRNKKAFSPKNYTGQPRYANHEFGEATNAIGLAAANGLIYVAMHDDNKVLVFNADTAAKVDEIHVEQPAGLFAVDARTVLAVSGNRIVQIDTASKSVRVVVSSGLASPRCVTVDGRGFIYVSDWGDSFQVKIFSREGAFVRAVGKAGGRPWLGGWDASGMLVPTGLAVTDAGRLWVAEDDATPNRVSVWDAGTGRLIRDYLGPAFYGGGVAAMDPDDPTIAYALGLRLKLDYKAGTYVPLATIDRRMDLAQPFYHQGFSYNVGSRIAYHDGQEYLIFFDDRHLTISKRDGDVFRPVAAMGGLEKGGVTTDGTDWIIWDSDLGNRRIPNYFPAFFKGHAGDNYTWVDRNNDGLVQTEEMQWYPAVGRNSPLAGKQVQASSAWGFSVGPDWSIYWSGFCADAAVIYRLPIKAWTPQGAPIYDIRDSKSMITRDSSMPPSSVFATTDGHLLVDYGYEDSKKKNTIEYFDHDGKSIWAIAQVKNQGLQDIQYDSVAGELTVPGIGVVFGSWSWHGNYLPYLFTADGLYVSSLLTAGRMGPDAAWGESLQSYYQDPKGVPYIINGANDAHHVLRISGLEGGRFETSLTLTQTDVDHATAWRAIPVVREPPRPIVELAWNQQTPIIDGNLNEWNMAAGASIDGSNGRSGRIALSRDEKNIYLAARVDKDAPFANKGNNWQTLFISGDCIDLMLATDSKGDPHRHKPIQGDERIILSSYQGDPIAVLYRPVVPGTKDPVQLSAARIDQISRLAGAHVVIRAQGNSYLLEASIPLKDIGLDPEELSDLAGDVGVVFADKTGSNRAQRAYFYNQQAEITEDLTSEATLDPAEWGTIQVPLGRNLLKNAGFEDIFADSPLNGWHVGAEKNGGHAKIANTSPHSGEHSLLLDQEIPVMFPAEAFRAQNFGDFVKAAGGGSGPGTVSVEQSVAVKAGHQYSFRAHYRTQDLHQEQQLPGPDRGLSRFNIYIDWTDGSRTLGAPLLVVGERSDIFEWRQVTNAVASDFSVNRPYQAPIGATNAVVRMVLDTITANDLPKVFVDDVEFIEITATRQ